MYDDSWYSYIPDQVSREAIYSSSQASNCGLKEPPLKQSDDKSYDTESVAIIAETDLESRSLTSSLSVTLAKRSKSYSDFCETTTPYLQQVTYLRKRCSYTDLSSCTEFSCNSHENFEDDLLEKNLEEYKLYYDQLALFDRHLDRLLDDTTTTLDYLATLSESFRTINTETTAFQEQCEDLLDDQKNLTKLTKEVGDALQYYAYLEPLIRRLNSTTAGRIVTSEDFLDILLNLNSCIEFMDQNPNYRDALIYKTRYMSLLDRSLNLILNLLSSVFKDVTDEVSKELRSKDHNETSEYMLLYGKYKAIQARLGSQVEELLKTENFVFGKKGDNVKISPYALRYHDLWGQVVDVYIKNREPVATVVSKNLKKFISVEKLDTDFDASARRAINYVLDICHNEKALMMHYFQNGPILAEYKPLQGWTKSINYAAKLEENILSHLKTLHNIIYPLIVKDAPQRVYDIVNWLETICVTPTDDDVDVEISRSDRKMFGQAYLRKFLWKSMDDIFINAAAELEHYKPTADDLKIDRALTSKEAELPTSDRTPTKVFDFHHDTQVSTAYPTVKIAIKLLVLYNDGFIDRPKDSNVSYEIVHQTTKSLQMAATMIKRNSTMMNAQLFLIKNLMLIENLFMTNEISKSVRQAAEFDFSPIWITFSELQEQRQLFNPLAFLSPLVRGKLLPTVVDRVLDARKEMEKVLVQQITAFSKTWQTRLIGKDGQEREAIEIELDRILKGIFEDEMTRTALWKIIRAESK
ncbi:Conserved oligomeric Golgi complex subunit 3 [Erysiphe neolycopersici]|uniref:Conserved oligomeric Golgi complex subunit 3 n=1 Tax=Erysiphe neolycopersici TaxID=212602 RepID=A0A420I422_9PEZI|nr:Conserved oligomeric Golgi complex subunit 3 [Erysiphe neolycopersici]